MTEDDTSRTTTTDSSTDDVETNATADLSTYKIKGERPDTNGIGVIGNTTATSSVTYGVLGMGDSPSTQAVFGAATANSLPSIPTGFPAGIWGYTDRSGAESAVEAAYGVYGEAAASNGRSFGVYSAGDSHSTGDHSVDGSISAGKVGLSAYLNSTNVSVASGSKTRVPFDQAVRDDFGGLDTSGTVGEYTIQEDGDYHIETAVNYAESLTGQTDYYLYVDVDGTTKAAQYPTVPGGTGEWAYVHQNVGKTLFGLTAGEKLVVAVMQNEGTSKELSNGLSRTYLTLHKVG